MASHAPPAANLNANSTRICINLPPEINSNGIWSWDKDPMTNYQLPVLEFQMFFFFAITESVHLILKRFGVPKFVSQIIGGAILSPDLLGGYKSFINIMLPAEGRQVFDTAGYFGFMLYLFISGVKIDVSMIPSVGKRALVIGILSILAPLIFSLGVAKLLSLLMNLKGSETSDLLELTSVNIATSFPAIATFLHEIEIINSELGRLCVSSAIISDIFGLSLRFTFITFLQKNVRIGKAAKNAGFSLLFVAAVVFIMRPAMLWVIKQTPEGRPVKNIYLYIIIIVVFVSGLVTNYMGHFVMLGPLIVGLAVPDGPPLGSALVDMFDTFVSAVFLPFYTSSAFLSISLRRPINHSQKLIRIANGILIVVSFIVKVAAGMAHPWYCKMSFVDAFLVGLILCCKGVPDLGGYLILRHAEIITDDMYAMSVVYLVICTSVVSIVVNYLYDHSRKYAGYQKRNIMDARKNSELTMLACIYRPSNIPAIINLLKAIHPTPEEPICVHALHLMELTGRVSPIFISHQMQKKRASHNSYSKNVIMSFANYTGKNSGNVTANIFTAISPPKLMHEDICTLALKKQVPFILLPFHKKWAMNGSVESEDESTRILNNKVLERAPCSVGILLDQGFSGGLQSSYQVCMIFIGGNDDREGLTLAKRMAKGSIVNLTVLRFIAMDDNCDVDWDIMLDSEELKDVKYNDTREQNVKYLENFVEDGDQTASIVFSTLEKYDLIIVGRSHGVSSPQTSGLAEWTEFPELGPLGDLLASSDIKLKASILVVQQQKLNSN